jgi:hypothetical protein
MLLILFNSINGPAARGALVSLKNELYRAQRFVEQPQSVQPAKIEPPAEMNLLVPFAMQAPFSYWGMPYQEACEEAALILADKYFRGGGLTKKIMDAEIKKLIEWEKQKFGLFTDTTVEEMKQIAVEYFGLNVKIDDDVSVENIKRQIAAGKLVLAPTAGRDLKNPFYKQPGPLYHILVIRGYTQTQFITNDVGIGRGFGYKFDFQTIIDAVHDLPLKENGEVFRPYDENIDSVEKEIKMRQGRKVILVVSKDFF